MAETARSLARSGGMTQSSEPNTPPPELPGLPPVNPPTPERELPPPAPDTMPEPPADLPTPAPNPGPDLPYPGQYPEVPSISPPGPQMPPAVA